MRKAIVITVTVTLCALWTARADAEARVTVHEFFGPSAGRLRDDVVNLLEHQPGLTIVTKGQIEQSAKRLGLDPYSPAGRIALARELQLSAWMTGLIKRQGDKLALTVVVHDGARHALVGRAALRGRNPARLSAEIRQHLWRRSRRAILRATAPTNVATPPSAAVTSDTPAEPLLITEAEIAAAAALQPTAARAADSTSAAAAASEPTSATRARAAEATDSARPGSTADSNGSRELPPPDPEPTQSAEPRVARDPGALLADDGANDPPDTAPARRRGELLRASIGVGSPYRSLAYSDPLSSSLGNYQLSGALMVDIQVALHPARAFMNGWPAWLGLDARAQITGSSSSLDRYKNRFTSRYDAYRVGLRARLPLGDHYLSAFSGYAINRFEISPVDKTVAPAAPSVDYRAIRSGLGTELAISSSFALALDAAWLQFLSVGPIAKWFPHSTAAGVELALAATYQLLPSVFARATASYQRNFFDFNAEPGDVNVAGGATDQYLALSVGAGLSL